MYFTSIFGLPIGIKTASFSLALPPITGIIKKLLKITRTERKKHNKIVMHTKSKLNIIEALMSQPLIDLEISH